MMRVYIKRRICSKIDNYIRLISQNEVMQDGELGRMWVGSFNTWCKSYDEVRLSSCMPSKVLLSRFLQDFHRPLGSPSNRYCNLRKLIFNH